HKPRTQLGVRLNDLVGDATHGVDVVILVVDGKSGVGRGDAFVYQRQVAQAGAGSRFCVVNKIDALKHDELIPQLAAAGGLGEFDEIMPVSARQGEGLAELLDLVVARLPDGPPLYPLAEQTDVPLQVHLAELVRESACAVTPE